jgi:GDP-L-fucose synthase
MNGDDKIFITGARGLVGRAVVQRLKDCGYWNLLVPTHRELDLCNETDTRYYFDTMRPQYVIMCAAAVGGIQFHTDFPAHALLNNLKIQNNVISAAHDYGVTKLLFLGSACAYPKHAQVPIREESLLTGALEPSNEGYALAKISGIKLCQTYRKQFGADFISCMPTNLYGPGDNYNLNNSHVIPGMLRRMHEAKGKDEVVLWGTGRPLREFLYSEDLADALLVLMQKYSEGTAINIGNRQGLFQLSTLAEAIADVVGFKGKIVWDHSRPDGTPDRTIDSTKMYELGWQAQTGLMPGLAKAYEDFLCHEHLLAE